MGKHAPFGRPGALDRLRLWWWAKERSFRVNSLVGLAVGTVAAGLVAAALSRDPSPSTGLVNATRPHLSTGSLPNPPITVDLRAAGVTATPLALPDQPASTSSTVASTAPLPVPATASTTATTTTTRPGPAAVADPGPQVIYAEVPAPPPTADPGPPPLPSTTRPPSTAPVGTTAPPPPSPTSTSPTTAVTLLPPLDLPPLLPVR